MPISKYTTDNTESVVHGHTPPAHVPTIKEGVRTRALIVGVLASGVAAALVTQAEMVQSSIRIGYLQFPPAALGLLLLIVLVNRIVKRVSRRFGLTGSDLLAIYCMMLVGAMTASQGVAQKLVPLLVTPNYFANTTNNWHGIFDRFLTKSLVAYDPRLGGRQPVADAYYSGLHPGAPVPWGAWIAPLLNWGILILLVLTAYLCLAAILRRQWVDNEKLAFPLAQLPLEIANDEAAHTFFRNPIMWMGALVPVFIFTIKGMHVLWPTISDILLQWNLNSYITTAPWNNISIVPLTISFAALGFFFLLPTDILFSIWFFFLLARVEQIVGIAYNFQDATGGTYPPFVVYQNAGAYFALAVYMFWLAKAHLKNVWLAAISQAGAVNAGDTDELMSYRQAFWGLVGSLLLAVLWLWHLGMSPLLAIAELFVGIFVIGLVMARSTAEAGMLMTETEWQPIGIYQLFGPISALGPANMTLLAFTDSLFIRDQRGLLFTGMLDSLRISDGAAIRRRSFVGIIALGILASLLVAIPLNIYLPYHIGAVKMDGWMEQGYNRYIFGDIASRMNPSATTDPHPKIIMFIVGFLVSALLTAMRTSFFWWPLHPLGYALAGSWSTIQFWFTCMMAWAIKSIVLRYGGIQLFRKVRPFFLGLVLGEFGMGVLFAILNLLFNVPTPAFPWS